MPLPHSVTFLDLHQVDGELQVLAISRGTDLSDWNLPGGKVDPGETLEEAVRREIYEEAELVAGPLFPVHNAICLGEVDFFNTTFMGLGTKYPANYPVTREGTVAWKPLSLLYAGTFAKYNIEMLRRLGIGS